MAIASDQLEFLTQQSPPKDFRLCEGPKVWVLQAADWGRGVTSSLWGETTHLGQEVAGGNRKAMGQGQWRGKV